MRVAGENAEELTAFLEKDDNPDRKKLLDSLTKKDNKDLRAEVLEDHLSAKRGSWSEDIHVQDLLCPRIWLEEIGAYRSICLQSRADMELCKPKYYRYPGRRI